ncbi:hypothetical protein [Halostella sp. PRR32]|uniref:DUF7538 family protein n=1 Tax=Halostella sp. PRR32 TaxID=3098147 RepID=UPI0034E06016
MIFRRFHTTATSTNGSLCSTAVSVYFGTHDTSDTVTARPHPYAPLPSRKVKGDGSTAVPVARESVPSPLRDRIRQDLVEAGIDPEVESRTL